MSKAFIVILLFLALASPILAIYDPLSVPNNKYGIHIADSNDIPFISTLVNSSGGQWGYVTLVIEETDRDVDKWQKIFNQLRRDHLIPLVRLATHPEGGLWTKPKPDSFNEWVDFLHQLNWPTENHYIILFNEPNHAKEWGGTINPEEYAEITIELSRLLKEKSEDFFILPAGLDGSASNGGETMDEATFLDRIFASHPHFFDSLDGWSSHSYPNPGFSGSPFATGKGTLQHFVWEQFYLHSLGIAKDYEIFITETGWVHSQGKILNSGLLTSDQVAQHMIAASLGAWTNEHIVAITPFLYSYQDIPFDHFSMRMLGTNQFYPHYYSYLSIPKTKGRPRQKDLLTPASPLLPSVLVTSSSYTFSGELANEGGSIIDQSGEFNIVLEDTSRQFTFNAIKMPTIEPDEKGTIQFQLRTPENKGTYRLTLALDHNGRRTIIESHSIRVISPPSITLLLQLGFKPTTTTKDITILVYDDKTLLAKYANREAKDGKVTVAGLTNIVPGKQYRIVALVPYYVPRQQLAVLSTESTRIEMPRFLPLDFNLDGAFTFKDLSAILELSPHYAISLLFGP